MCLHVQWGDGKEEGKGKTAVEIHWQSCFLYSFHCETHRVEVGKEAKWIGVVESERQEVLELQRRLQWAGLDG